MKIVFRADASSEIGTGHVMRCLALVDEIQRRRNVDIYFASRNLPEHLQATLKTKGIKYLQLQKITTEFQGNEMVFSSWVGDSQKQDASATIQALREEYVDLIIVDHYALDERWESALRPCCKKIMAIDDLADRQHDCDFLLDQNLHTNMHERYIERVPTHCQVLIGPQYALLRKDFRLLRDQVAVRNGSVKKILLFFGGVDLINCTGLAIEALAKLDINANIDVVIGAQHPYPELIEKACLAYGFTYHIEVTYMAKLMAEADLAIGAGGSTTWERCCLGLPSLIVTVAENQRSIASALDDVGGCIYVCCSKKVSQSIIENACRDLLGNPDKVRAISHRAFSLVDGDGVIRVCQELGL